MSAFSAAELGYLLGERRLGRLATVGTDGTPHVVPVGWMYNGSRRRLRPRLQQHSQQLLQKASVGLRQGREALLSARSGLFQPA